MEAKTEIGMQFLIDVGMADRMPERRALARTVLEELTDQAA